jgi:tetratricopeptide (TPR) repeat protein
MLLIATLVAATLSGCAHAPDRAKPESGPRADARASPSEDGDDSIEEAMEVELEDLEDEKQKLDSEFWDKDDGILGDTRFGGDRELDRPRSLDIGGDTTDQASTAVRRALVESRGATLVAAIESAEPDDVEQVLAWRERLRDLDMSSEHTRYVADIRTIRKGVEYAAERGDWDRIGELDAVREATVEELSKRSRIRRNRKLGEAVYELEGRMLVVRAAAHYHRGERESAAQVAARWVVRDGGVPLVSAIELAEQLLDLEANEMVRELLSQEVLETGMAAQSVHTLPVPPRILGRGARTIARAGGSETLVGAWAHSYLRSAALESEVAFRNAMRGCRNDLGSKHCEVDRVRERVAGSLLPDLMLACRMYRFRREWQNQLEAREGYRRFLESCDAECMKTMQYIAFQQAFCQAGATSAEDAIGVAEAVFAVPLQFGDVEFALELLDEMDAHPYSKARALLTVDDTHRFLRNPGDRIALVEKTSAWLDEALGSVEAASGDFPADQAPRVAVARLQIKSAELLWEAGLEQRAREVLLKTEIDAEAAPRLFTQVANRLSDMGESGAAADMLIEHVEDSGPGSIEGWLGPVVQHMTPRHALRVYRAAAAAGFVQMAANGLSVAVAQGDLSAARAIVEGVWEHVDSPRLLWGSVRDGLEEASASSSEWARFYLRLLEREADGERGRLGRVRLARVIGMAKEPSDALSAWESVFEKDDAPCAVLDIALRDGPGRDVLAAMIELDDISAERSPRRAMLSVMLRMRMRRIEGDPLAIEARHRAQVTELVSRVIEEEPLVCASPVGFADIMAGHGFPEAALSILDTVRAKGLRKSRSGVPFEPVRQRFLEMRVALDIDDVQRARDAVDRVANGRRRLRQALQRELGWYLHERGREDEAADLFEASLFSLERLYVDEAVAGTSYAPLMRWRAERSSIQKVDDTLVELARVRQRQGRGEEFAKFLATLRSRSSLDNVRRRRLALRLMSIFKRSDDRAQVLLALNPRGLSERLWVMDARTEFMDGDAERGFAKLDVRATKSASPYSFWLEQAYWFIGRGQFDFARTAMERAERVGGDGPGLAVARGRIALYKGDEAAAMEQFRAALGKLYLRTTVERRVKSALQSFSRPDLIAELRAEGLLDSARSQNRQTTTVAERLKKLDSALSGARPGDALGRFMLLVDVLAERGQLQVRAREVAELIAETGYPTRSEFRELIVDRRLVAAALVLADAEGRDDLSDAFRLWAFYEAGITQKGVELALRMLDPVSSAYEPGVAMRLTGAFDRREELFIAASRASVREGPLGPSAPYLVDSLVLRGQLADAFEHVKQAADLVEARSETLTSAQLTRWSLIQSMLVRRGLAGEAQSILEHEPHAGAIRRRAYDERRRDTIDSTMWRRTSPIDVAYREATRDRAPEVWLPEPAEFAHLSLDALAPALLRASAPFGGELVRDKTLAARVEAAPGLAPLTVAWSITLLEAGEMKRGRSRMRALLERRGSDEHTVERLVSELGRRGFWSEIAFVIEPELEDAAISPTTRVWIEHARGQIGARADRIEPPSEQVARLSRMLRRPYTRDEDDRETVISAALASRRESPVSDMAAVDALRRLGPLEQWCLAPDALSVVLELARVQRVPERRALERCRQAIEPSGASDASDSDLRDAGFREGVRRGILSPEEYHAYRVFRWRVAQ